MDDKINLESSIDDIVNSDKSSYVTNEMIYLESLSDEERESYLDTYYAELESFEEMKDKHYEEYYNQHLKKEEYEYTSENGENEKIPMNIIGVDGIGIHANVKDLDGFIAYLKGGVTRSGKIFYHKDNRHNLFMKDGNKYFYGIAFYGSVWFRFNEKPFNNLHNVSLVIYPRRFNTMPDIENLVKDIFFNYLDKKSWELFRLDIDFTMFKDLSSYYFHKKGTQKFETITRTRYGSNGSVDRIEMYDSEDEVIKEDVETRYIGNRRSAEFYIRLYNKRKQFEMRIKEKQLNNGTKKKIPDVFPYISRLEIEIKKNGLNRWKECLEKLTLKRPNYWDSEDLKPDEKVKIAGFLADNRLFSTVSQNTRDKFRAKIAALQESDDIILKLEKEFKMSHKQIIDTVEKWTGKNIDY